MTAPVVVKIQPLHPALGESIPLPRRMSEHAAGFDVAAALDEPLTLEPGARALVGCGFAMAVPPGYECQVRPRSGLAHKHGVTVLNAPGTIDSDSLGNLESSIPKSFAPKMVASDVELGNEDIR